MSDLRWQGHSHEELFEQINEGPGADGSTESVRRWRELTRALGEIDDGLADALAAAMSGWTGAAADSAHGGLRPLGDWARQAQEAAELMRERAEQQAEFVSKARNDMPAPVAVSAEEPGLVESALTHLVGAQTDYEVQEARRDAAEQRAFEVMRGYESSTTANTTALASFAPPPQVVVDAPSASGSPGASGGGHGITLSWGGVPATTMPSPRAGDTSAGRTPGVAARGGRSPGSGTSGRAPASGTSGNAPASGASSSTGTSPAGTSPAGASTAGTSATSTSAAGNGTSGNRTEDDDPETDEQVDQDVTEEFGDPGGFFEQPRTLSRPVIGGQPG